MQSGLIGTIQSTIQLPSWFRVAPINYVYVDCTNPKLVEDPKTIRYMESSRFNCRVRDMCIQYVVKMFVFRFTTKRFTTN